MSTFIEVGSCDFDTCEKLIQNGWKGIVIEPVKYYFDLLYKYPNIHYENIAISDEKGQSEIHYVDPKYIQGNNQTWIKGISCLKSMSGPLSLKGNDHLPRLRQTVETDTLESICTKYDITYIDYLKIDTEGHDLRVLKSLNFDKVHVKFIKIEHKHLHDETCQLINFLEDLGYIIYKETDDIYAIK